MIGLTPEDRKRALSQLQSPTLDGRAARQRFNDALQKTDLEFQAPGIQMNQMYIDSPATYVQPGDQKPDHSHLDLLKDIAVSTYPGHHLPHVWFGPVAASVDTGPLRPWSVHTPDWQWWWVLVGSSQSNYCLHLGHTNESLSNWLSL